MFVVEKPKETRRIPGLQSGFSPSVCLRRRGRRRSPQVVALFMAKARGTRFSCSGDNSTLCASLTGGNQRWGKHPAVTPPFRGELSCQRRGEGVERSPPKTLPSSQETSKRWVNSTQPADGINEQCRSVFGSCDNCSHFYQTTSFRKKQPTRRSVQQNQQAGQNI